jgi:uncharacterized membrane protein YcaP (DUF421 family)
MTVSDSLLAANNKDILWWQMTVRAAVVFVYGVIVLRIAGRKAFGKNSALDIVLSIIIGSILSRTVTGNSPMIPSLVASTALVALHYLLSRASARYRWLDHLSKGRAHLVVHDGKPFADRLRRGEMSEDDLMEGLRLHGKVAALDKVALAYLERNGDLSVITKD